jgi:hypothetical protein
LFDAPVVPAANSGSSSGHQGAWQAVIDQVIGQTLSGADTDTLIELPDRIRQAASEPWIVEDPA